jgi:Rrf2 family protein
MQITRQTEYAIRTVIELCNHKFGEFVQTRAIADKKEIPELFLAKTIQVLAKAGIVQTQRGTQGGVRLTKPGNEITLKDVITAVEGSPAINRCLNDADFCKNITSCKVHQALEKAQQALLRELDSVTFDNLK